MIRVSDSPIDPEALLLAFREGLQNAGAVTSFTGIVRDDGQTEALSLSHYPGFTELQIEGFVSKAKTRWSLQGTLIVHRVGRMVVGDPIVIVAAASEHRRDAFEACDYLMDRLKCDAPFWKQEVVGGETRWIEPRAQDHSDLDRWSS
ncbi:MAG: molybdenum cofactor biosynthesis protein MoaE [Litorimonas sp.]